MIEIYRIGTHRFPVSSIIPRRRYLYGGPYQATDLCPGSACPDRGKFPFIHNGEERDRNHHACRPPECHHRLPVLGDVAGQGAGETSR